MAGELDTLITAIKAAIDEIDEIKVTHKELPPVLTDPPEAWIKMGSGMAEPSAFGQQEEVHAIELWVYVGMTDAPANEETIRKLWSLVVRKLLEDDTLGGACEGIHDQMSYTTGWQSVGGPEYRRMEVTVPCTVNVLTF